MSPSFDSCLALAGEEVTVVVFERRRYLEHLRMSSEFAHCCPICTVRLPESEEELGMETCFDCLKRHGQQTAQHHSQRAVRTCCLRSKSEFEGADQLRESMIVSAFDMPGPLPRSLLVD